MGEISPFLVLFYLVVRATLGTFVDGLSHLGLSNVSQKDLVTLTTLINVHALTRHVGFQIPWREHVILRKDRHSFRFRRVQLHLECFLLVHLESLHVFLLGVLCRRRCKKLPLLLEGTNRSTFVQKLPRRLLNLGDVACPDERIGSKGKEKEGPKKTGRKERVGRRG